MYNSHSLLSIPVWSTVYCSYWQLYIHNTCTCVYIMTMFTATTAKWSFGTPMQLLRKHYLSFGLLYMYMEIENVDLNIHDVIGDVERKTDAWGNG